MKTLLYRILGIALILAALGGFIISTGALIGLWNNKPRIIQSLLGNMELTRSTLRTTADGLDAAEESLERTISSLTGLQDTVAAVAKTLDDTTPMLDALTTLSQKDLPDTLTATQTSLASAQESARLIDNVLTLVGRLPGIDYNPPVPLNEALLQVSQSLENMPQTLKTMEGSVSTTTSNLEVIQADISLMASDIENIKASLVESQSILDEYQALVADLQNRADTTSTNLPEQIDTILLAVTVGLIWLAITQLGLLALGWELFTWRHTPNLISPPNRDLV